MMRICISHLEIREFGWRHRKWVSLRSTLLNLPTAIFGDMHVLEAKYPECLRGSSG